MSLNLLTLGLLSTPPAQAQHYGPPPPPSSWQITYSSKGSASAHQINGNLSNPPTPIGPTPWNSTSNGGGAGGQYILDATTSGTVTATLTWVPGTNTPNDPPPSKVYIVETANASWSTSSTNTPTAGTDASDGLGDPAVPNQNEGGETSSGTHLTVQNGSSGTITLGPFSMDANTPTYVTNKSTWGYATAGASLLVSIDKSPSPRAVTITSSIDPTYHKGKDAQRKPAPVANVPASDGTITADSVALNESNNRAGDISYTATPTGSWAPASSYHWYSALIGTTGNGTFTMPGDPPIDLDVFYLDGNDGTMHDTSQEHINLHCTDASDGANATANYYINWHDEIEGWSTVVDVKQYGAFVRVTPIYHPIVDDAKFSYDVENSVKVSTKATGEGSLGTEQVGEKFGVELGADYESATKVTVEYPLVANKANWIERQAFWEHREGTVDNYDTQGYVGLLHWTLDSAYHPGDPLIDYGEFQRASATDPSN